MIAKKEDQAKISGVIWPPALTKTRPFRKNVLWQALKPVVESGINYTTIAEKFNTLGYRTKRNLPLTSGTVSWLALTIGGNRYRKFTKHSAATKLTKPTYTIPEFIPTEFVVQPSHTKTRFKKAVLLSALNEVINCRAISVSNRIVVSNLIAENIG